MIKRKKSICLALAVLSAVSLSGCSSVTKNDEGYIITYTYNGKDLQISTGDIIARYLTQDKNNHAAAFFDALNEIVIRNAFEDDGKLEDFLPTVNNAANDAIERAKNKADDNGQTWEDYLNTNVTGSESLTLEEKENEYFLQLQYEEMQTTVQDEYFETFSGYDPSKPDVKDPELQDEYNLLYGTNGYIQQKVPYHVRHILVQVDANQDYGYSRGHISSEDVHQIYQVVTALVNGTSFAETANLYSDDPGNEQDGQKLGGEYIMNNETSFVNEFKLGVYTYDLILHNTHDTNEATYSEKYENLHIKKNVREDLENFGVSYIPYGVIAEMERVRDVTTKNGTSVYGGDEDYLPRNIYFNKYFQNRNVAFITDKALSSKKELVGSENPVYDDSYTGQNGEFMITREDPVSGNSKIYSDIDENGHYKTSTNVDRNLTEAQKLNFKPLTINGHEENVLCDTNGNPILVVRNQESSSGIHFIVIERSAFDTEGNDGSKASIEQYYAPVSPKQIDGIDPSTGRPYWLTDGTFPTYVDNGITLPKKTYVQTEDINADSDVNNRVGTYTSRVSTLSTDIRTSIDTYDTYEWLNPEGENKITLNEIAGNNIQETVDRYINKEKRASIDSAAQTLEDAWISYLNSINTQTKQRQYMLLPEILAADFGNENLYKEGAPGYNPAYSDINTGNNNQ